MALSYPSSIHFFFSSIFPDLAFRLHTLSIVFWAAHYITHILALLAACLGVLCPYPVRHARPSARLAASMVLVGYNLLVRASFLSCVSCGYLGVLLVGSSLLSVTSWCGDPRAQLLWRIWHLSISKCSAGFRIRHT